MRDTEFQDNLDLPLRIRSAEGPPRAHFWRRMSLGMEAIIYVLLAFALFKLFGPELDRQDELDAEINRLTQIRDDRAEMASNLRQEHRLLKTDREYLEKVARDRLALQREGEYIIRIDRGLED
ncbi:MAG: septum formation initiator family protein [Verrucomicrobiota bacterium]